MHHGGAENGRLPVTFGDFERYGMDHQSVAPAQREVQALGFADDHFRQELLAQLGRAATRGRIDVLINSGELCRSITRGSSGSASCCDAMQEEFRLGDTLLLDRTNGAGMTIRYRLPRTVGIQMRLPFKSN
jgi:hypothetical protein